jgi:hypothetical protein
LQVSAFSLFWIGLSSRKLCSLLVFFDLCFVSMGALIISVKQYGQAAYGSPESCCKFKVFSGELKVFLHEGFEQVSDVFSLFSNPQ